MYPLVSVIIPSYNHELYIVEAIESVLTQSYPKVELVIVDDGSTDNTLAKIEPYRSSSVNIIIQQNQGADFAINKGLSLARGEFVTILNSDDIYHSQRLERLVSELSSRDELSLIFTNLTMIDASGNPYSDFRWEQYQTLCGQCRQRPAVNYFLVGNIAYTTSNFFMRRALFEQVGNFKKLRYTHDWNFALRSSLVGEPVWLQEDLLLYRVHEKNTLNESSLWLSIFEDSYNLASYLYRFKESKVSMDEIFQIYLSCFTINSSYLPFYVGFFLSLLFYRVVEDEDDLLDCIHEDGFADKMKMMVDDVSYDMRTYQSLPWINALLASYNDQAEMINGRDICIRKNEEMINERDLCIRKKEEDIGKMKKALEATFDYKIKKIVKKFCFK